MQKAGEPSGFNKRGGIVSDKKAFHVHQFTAPHPHAHTHTHQRDFRGGGLRVWTVVIRVGAVKRTRESSKVIQ